MTYKTARDLEAARRALESLGQETHALQADQQHEHRLLSLQARLTSLAQAEVQLQRGVVGLESQRRTASLQVQVQWRLGGIA